MNHIRPKQGKINRDCYAPESFPPTFRQLSARNTTHRDTIDSSSASESLHVSIIRWRDLQSGGELYAGCDRNHDMAVWTSTPSHPAFPRPLTGVQTPLRSVLIDGLRPDEARSKTMAAGPSKGSRYTSRVVLSSSSWARGSSLAHLAPHMSIMKSI